MKITMKEFREFDNSSFIPWEKGYYIEDYIVTINGVEIEDEDILDDSQVVNIEDGCIVTDHYREDALPNDYGSLVSCIKKWRRTKTMKTIIVEIPIDAEAEFKLLLKKIKGVIV